LYLLNPLPAELPAELVWPSSSQTLQLPAPLGVMQWSDRANVDWPLTVRFRRGGERIVKPDGHHQGFKDFCQQRGIPPWLRHAIPMLYHGDELLAIGDEPVPSTALSRQAENRPQLRWLRSHLLCGW